MYFKNSLRGATNIPLGVIRVLFSVIRVLFSVIKANIHILIQSVTKMSSLQSNLRTDISSQESLLLITETSFPV